MNAKSPVPPNAVMVAGRYRVLGDLGAGGMARVVRALDTRTGKELALKQLRIDTDAEEHSRGIAYLEREFHTLSQLAHPRVISVFDYGVDGVEPYYTMELLDGGDLHERSPLDWQTACAFARDVCSALSLLHSRRLVHRDLSPRNVRCTSDGRAKLIDFGAMVPMGPTKSVVGTPAICAPEVVRLQPLDGRADLYALGATLYFTLTGRFPYPARTFTHLETLWKQGTQPPSELVSDIPEALDALVMDLLQLDAAVRPSSASEVTQRLSAIAGLDLDEQLLSSQAYLTTPVLVGRDVQVARLRRYAGNLQRGRGRALIAEAEPGVGRTRFLDACSLEGKLVGAVVARADASDAAAGDFGLARALGRRVLESARSVATEAAAPFLSSLTLLLPELGTDSNGSTRPKTPDGERAVELQDALRMWLVAISKQRPLMLVVDDVHRIDAPSAALVALLAKEARQHRMLVISSSVKSDKTSPSAALRLIAEASGKVDLAALTPPETETLLRSVFGNVPNVQLLAAKLSAISGGRPRDLMLLAQHLVDRKLVNYGAGVWSLPVHLYTADLPASLADALLERVRALSAGARRLAQAMALAGDNNLAIDECALLAGTRELLPVMRWLDELVIAGIVVSAADKFAIDSQTCGPVLVSTVASADEAALHASVATVYERRGSDDFRTAMHLFRSGQNALGLDILLAHAERSQQQTDSDPGAFMKLLDSMPSGWLRVYDHALTLCESLQRPRRDRFLLERRVVGIAAYDSASHASRSHYLAPFKQLSHDCGLDIYATLDDNLPAKTRLHQAMAMAKQRFDSLPEHERVLDPLTAAQQLTRVVLTCLGVTSTSLDLELLRALPSLEPLAILTPANAIVQSVRESVEARLTGRVDDARAHNLDLLERLSNIDALSLDETYRKVTMLGLALMLANLDAALGLDSTNDWIERVASHPLHEVNACHVRALLQVWRNDPLAADKSHSQAELLMVQKVRRSTLEGTHLLREVPAYALSDDLTRLKQSIDSVKRLAERFEDWQPVLHYARGEHARIRGDLPAALAELEAALRLMPCAEHQLWTHTAAARVVTLCAMERFAEARDAAESYLASAEAGRLGFACNYLRAPLALACARVGDSASAWRHADRVVTECTERGVKGLNLALAYETRAWVAILTGDAVRAESNLAQVAQAVRAGSSHTLIARYERARRAAHKQFAPDSLPPIEDRLPLGTQLMVALTGCDSTQQRAQRSLDILLAEVGGSQGFLFAVTSDGCTLAASQADHPLPPDIDAMARRSLANELRDDVNTGELAADATAIAQDGWTSLSGRTYRSVLLGHAGAAGFTVTGLGVILWEPNLAMDNAANIATELSRYASLHTEAPRLSLRPG